DHLFDNISGASLPTVKKAIAEIILRDKSVIVDVFYHYMMKDDDAAQFLSVKTVEQRLKPGLERWLEALLCFDTEEELQAALTTQRQIGEIHARAEIPIYLVARGMRLIKREIGDRLVARQMNSDETTLAIMRVNHLIDIAFEEMSMAFLSSHERGVRVDQAYRTFAAGQNLSLEREKQIGALLDWENRLFRALATEMAFHDLSSIRDSAFGLWLHHKAILVFDETRELALIDECMERIDNDLFPQVALVEKSLNRDELRPIVKSIITCLEQIKYLIINMFDRLTDLEVGRDELTQLFNRRFLPTILKREIEMARRNKTSFCVFMLDVDHFKRVNDDYGHDAGDKVLQQVAGLLTKQIRASDFVFRYGGEEFLLVLAEADASQAQLVAKNICRRIEALEILLSDDQTLKVTISIGIAQYDGHPDYQNLINRADKALYKAKHSGRNRFVLAPS
ncbi:MAG: diguanylate cyclase, partial [Gammaproteobacteria bacterium]